MLVVSVSVGVIGSGGMVGGVVGGGVGGGW